MTIDPKQPGLDVEFCQQVLQEMQNLRTDTAPLSLLFGRFIEEDRIDEFEAALVECLSTARARRQEINAEIEEMKRRIAQMLRRLEE